LRGNPGPIPDFGPRALAYDGLTLPEAVAE
jgi:hypothetical protein